MSVKRCYLCGYANKLVEHPERKARKFFIECKLDHEEYEPCHECEDFIEKLKWKGNENGRTYSLEENY